MFENFEENPNVSIEIYSFNDYNILNKSFQESLGINTEDADDHQLCNISSWSRCISKTSMSDCNVSSLSDSSKQAPQDYA